MSIAYSYMDVGDHLFSEDVVDNDVNLGSELDLGDIKSQSVQIGIDYGLTNRLALGAAVAPGIVSKYDGDFPDNEETDDGVYRGGLQDFGLQARYMLLRDPLVLTPFVGFSVPSHDYETFGHVAIGKNLAHAQLGFYAGRILDFISDDLYAQAGYFYAIVEKNEGMRTNRSHASLNMGYFIVPSVTLSSGAYYQETHGGIDWLYDTGTDHGWHNHDRHADDDHLNLDGTLAVSVNDGLSVFTSYTQTVWGQNSHEERAISLGLSWSAWVGQ